MTKSNMLKKRNKIPLVDEFDFSDFIDSDEDNSMMAGFMQGVIEASNNQMTLALELTKVIVNKNTDKTMDADQVFSIFKQASKAISDSSPLKALWEKVSENN